MTSEPPQNEIDSSTPTRLQKTTKRRRQLGIGSHQRAPRRRRARGPTSLVAARSRPGDDEMLIRIWAPSRASSWGTVRCQKSSQMPIPRPTPRRDGTARSRSPRREEPALVEQAVGRQEELAMDVPRLAVLEQGGGDEQPMVVRLLDERDDRRDAPASRAPARSAAGRPGAATPRRRGPAAGSRSGRVPGRRPGPRRSERACSSSSWCRAMFTSSCPSAGAIWASATRMESMGASIRDVVSPNPSDRRPEGPRRCRIGRDVGPHGC